MPPKIPQSLVAVISPALALLFFLLPSLAKAQLGYAELLSEQGSNLAPTTGSRLVYIPEQSGGWRYWTGDLGAPASDWRLSTFVEPGGWLTGQTSVGYGDGDDNTVLGSMKGNFTTVYLRHQFNIATGAVPAMLHLRLYVDDGAIVWLNGTEIARANVTTAAPGASSTASSAVNDASWQDYFIAGTGGIAIDGTNTVSIHALNVTANSSDFSIDIELARPRLTYGQVEATTMDDNFLPDLSPDSTPAVGYEFQGSGDLSSKNFEIRTISGGVNFATSSHALNVANFSYRYSGRPGFFLTHFKNWESGGFLGSGLLNSGTSAPDPSFTQVQNHSWISDQSSHTNAQLNRYVRSFDYMAVRDKVLCAVGLNNLSNTAVPQIWGCSYNSVVVGRTDGLHSRGGTVAGVDGAGRIKPDIVSVGSGGATSYSTANVSGTAALLLGYAYDRPQLSGVYHPEVNKAIMMASATKEAGWSNTPSQPLDPVYGAGTLNVYDCFHLLIAGEHPPAAAGVPPRGWDYATLEPAATAAYTFEIPEDQLATACSIILTWFRQFEDDPAANNFATLPTLPDFELRLYESQDGILGTQLEFSDSAADNVEHVYLENLLPGEYTITVQTDTASPYAIAWDSWLFGQPQVAIDSIDGAAGSVSLQLENLITGTTYTLEHSDDLTNWTPLHTVTASSEVETFMQTSVPLGSRFGFYRISWTP